MQTITIEPQIYVACLASYNNGILHGKWIDATLSGDEIMQEVKAMLADSKIEEADEWAIHDYQGFECINIDEWQSFDEVSEIANMLIDSRWDSSLIASLYEHLGSGTTTENVIDYLHENYLGEHESLGHWAEQFLDETGGLESIPENLRYYINFDKYGLDADINGDIFTVDISNRRGFHIFWNH